MHHRVKDQTTLHVLDVRWRRQCVGVAWEGGRKEFGGPVFDEPFAYCFALCSVIDNHGGSSADDARTGFVECSTGDTFEIEGLAGVWELKAPARFAGGDGCKLAEVGA